MDKILNSLGLPNDIGFEISLKTLRSLLNRDAYDNLYLTIRKMFDKVTESIGLDESLNLGISMDFTIKFKDGQKIIAMDEYTIIQSIYKYFNTDYEYSNDVNFALEEKEKLNAELKKLKDFLRDKINEMRNVTEVSQLKQISNSLYESYMMGYNDRVKENDIISILHWNNFLQTEMELDIERISRLRMWLETFISELTKPLSFSLFSEINEDKTKLFFAIQFLNLAVALNDPYRSILIRNSIELVKSIKNKNVYINDVEFWELSPKENDDSLSRVFYKRVDLKLPLSLIDKFSKYEDIHKNVEVLLKYSNKDFENKNIQDVYEKISSLIQNALKSSSEMGLEDVNLVDLKNNALQELKTSNNKERQLKLKSFIERVDTFLHYLQPFKVQEGAGKFKNFHVLYYKNGMVALDKLNGEYGLMYVMPIMVYLTILKNDNIKDLYEVRNILGVRCISHRKTNWKDIAKMYINNHEITNDEISVLESVKDISLPISDNGLETLKEKYRGNEYLQEEIKEKEIERKQRYEEIDEEIRSNVSSECAKELLDEEEEKIADEVKESNDFLAINDSSVTSTATRNPKVSLFTKLRTKDEHGAMHCDMCDEFTSFDTRNFETHHIIPLSAGGIDNIYNTVCLCGNCHNRMHSKFPPTMYEMGKLLEKVRERIKSTTPYYLQKFDRLFNPNYNALYGDDDYDKESLYYENNKEREDRNFLVEWNSRR